MSASRSSRLALVVLLAVLTVASVPSGPSSEAAQTTPAPRPTVLRGAGPAGHAPTILGDINNDGIVDIRDYGIWRQHFGEGTAPAAPRGAPGPLVGGLLGLGGLAGWRRRRPPHTE